MKHVQVPDPHEEALVRGYVDQLSAYSNGELIEAYNKQAHLGMVGVRRQVLYIMALHRVFLNRFGRSPVWNERKNVWGLRGTIVLRGESFSFLPKPRPGQDANLN